MLMSSSCLSHRPCLVAQPGALHFSSCWSVSCRLPCQLISLRLSGLVEVTVGQRCSQSDSVAFCGKAAVCKNPSSCSQCNKHRKKMQKKCSDSFTPKVELCILLRDHLEACKISYLVQVILQKRKFKPMKHGCSPGSSLCPTRLFHHCSRWRSRVAPPLCAMCTIAFQFTQQSQKTWNVQVFLL